ncbi:MAG: hypothetical protein V4463_24835 [Pseudomonadota bacterium]
MDSTARKRWFVLLTLLSTTIVAIFYPVEEANMPRARQARVPERAATEHVVATVNLPETTDAEVDPFAPRGWQAPPQPPAVAPKANVAIVETPPPPPGPPSLPYQYVGSLNDEGKQVIYLGRGEQALIAHVGDVLDGTYKVLTIDARQIQFEHIPTGQKQSLAFPLREN